MKADFEADTLSFCPPYSVKFKDKSSGGRITSRRWDFGQGGSSNTNNPFPSASYVSSGLYTVKLVVSDGTVSDSVTKSAYIHALTLPQADFTTQQAPKGCVALDLNYQDATIRGSAPIQSYSWNFGDGYLSTQFNPQHQYTLDGKYTVSYTVTDTNGCSSTIKKVNFVDALAGPKARISTNPAPSSCQSPHTVSFINRSTGVAPMTYWWSLDNGNTSTAANPAPQTYSTGTYDIILVARDADGCKDTLVENRYVTVGAAVADFTAADTFCLSDSNLIQFTNLSIGGSTYFWDFGDGATSTERNPQYRYRRTGTFQVRLIIGGGSSCSDTIIKSVEVIQPVVNFTSDVNYWCGDTTVEFTPNSTYEYAADKALWRYMYWYPGKIGPDPYGKKKMKKGTPGWHYDSLTVYYPKWGSCSAKVTVKTLRIWRPLGKPIISPVEGCVPLNVQLQANITPLDSLQLGTWIFDASTTFRGRNTTKTYTAPGSYDAKYVVRHKRGCLYEYGPYAIRAGTPPKADFTVDTNVFCAGEPVLYKNLSTDTNKITDYLWKMDLQKGTPTSSKKEPYANYTDTGYKTVFLRADYNGCKDSITKKNFVRILGPIGRMQVTLNCDSPYHRTFSPNNWVDYHRFSYYYGDGVKDSVNATNRYEFVSRGDYNTVLTLYNDSNGCVFTSAMPVQIRDIILRSSVDSNIACHPYLFHYETSKSQDVAGGEATLYGTRHLYPGTSFDAFQLDTARKGPDRSILIGFDVNGCRDTNYHRVKTYRPVAKIVSNVDTGCGTLYATMLDSSTSDTNITYRKWVYGKQSLLNQTQANYAFQSPGVHEVQLLVRDELGCEEVVSQFAYVFKPLPMIEVDTQVCRGEILQFKNVGAAGGEKHFWSFDDSLFGTGVYPKIAYDSAGQKTIQIRVVDSMGCDSILTKPLWVDVQGIKEPNLLVSPKDTTCYPADIHFEIYNYESYIKYFYWRFDTSETFVRTPGPNVIRNYGRPGNYDLEIKLVTRYGCEDSFKLDSVLNITGPFARFSIEDTLCVKEEASFQVDSVTGVYEFRMDYGDGIVDTFPGNTRIMKHAYQNPGFHPVYLIFTDSLGHCVKSWLDSAYIQEVNAHITPSDTIGCSPFDLLLMADTAPVQRYQWYLNGNLLSNDQQYTNTYTKPGRYTIFLEPLNLNTGCKDLDSVSFTVHPKPQLSKSGDGIFCYLDSVEAQVSGAKYYRWAPRDYLSATNQSAVKLMPEEDIGYTVTGTNEFGCYSKIDLEFQVVHAPYLDYMQDTSLYAGEFLQVNNVYNSDWNYRWTPAYNLSCSDCPDPEILVDRDMRYRLTVSDKYGCFEVDTSFYVDAKEGYKLLIPNAFTPNYDGINETFSFYAEGFKDLDYFRIFDRWGNEVYSFNGLEDEWDGLYQGQEWTGTSKLVYSGRFIKYNGEPVDVSGFIVLLQ